MIAPDSTTMQADGSAPARYDQERADRLSLRRINAFTTGLTILALPALLWVARLPGDHNLPLAVLVGTLFVLGEMVTVDVEFRHESQIITFLSIPLIAGLLILPPALVIGLRVITMLIIFAGVQKQPPFKLAFNTASTILDITIATALLTFVPEGPLQPQSWLLVIAAVIAGDTFSSLTTTAAISCYQGRWEPPAPLELAMGAVVAIFDVVIAIVLVTLLQLNEPAVVLVLLVGVFFVMLTRAYARVTNRYKSLTLLDRFTQELGESVIDNTLVKRLLTESSEILHAERSWLLVRDGEQETRFEVMGSELAILEFDDLDRSLFARTKEETTLIECDEDGLSSQSGATDDSDSPTAGFDQIMATRLVAEHETTERILAVADRSGNVRPFDADDVAIFDTLAVHAGLALRNLDLVDALRHEIRVTEQLATHDTLTDLPNRVLFQKRIDVALGTGEPVAVMLIDLDRFKEVNDTLGHQNGDLLLMEVGQRLAAQAAENSTVARFGGDEFAILLVDCANEAEAKVAAEAMREELERPFRIRDVSLDVSGSIGIALSSEIAHDGDTLIRHADVAMYLAKNDRTGIEVYRTERDHYSPHRLAMAGRLRSAIENRDLVMFYQPQINLETDEVLGVEALIRWPQPSGNPIPPDEFIYIAEHTGLIHPLTQFVLEETIHQAALWYQSGQPLRMSLNLSAYNLLDRELVGVVQRLLTTEGLPPELLMVELTETAAMSNPTRSVEIMKALREIGVSIAIDDFGTGHSSLSYLTGVPATELKIDQSFVFGLGTDEVADTIVRTIVDLGMHLGLELVAEGVETGEHARMLSNMGCHIAQGYFYSRPLDVRGFEIWRENRSKQAAETPQSVS